MYCVRVRDSIMIAHSLNHTFFGPAQGLHGATYVVDAEFQSSNLTPLKVVLDISKAKSVLSDVLSQLNYRNLDDLCQFDGQLTTTEFMAKYIHDELKNQLAETFDGSIKVTLGETHDAWASYQGQGKQY